MRMTPRKSRTQRPLREWLALSRNYSGFKLNLIRIKKVSFRRGKSWQRKSPQKLTKRNSRCVGRLIKGNWRRNSKERICWKMERSQFRGPSCLSIHSYRQICTSNFNNKALWRIQIKECPITVAITTQVIQLGYLPTLVLFSHKKQFGQPTGKCLQRCHHTMTQFTPPSPRTISTTNTPWMWAIHNITWIGRHIRSEDSSRYMTARDIRN